MKKELCVVTMFLSEERQKKAVKYLLLVLFLCGSFLLGRLAAECVSQGKNGEGASDGPRENSEGGTKKSDEKVEGCVVIDVGHGGYDPGKVGINEVREKDINLAIAKYLEEDLVNAGVKVVLTRNEDVALCREDVQNKKLRDMQKRLEILEENAPICAVSIHQNSYTDERVRGAQMFFYKGSVEGEKLALALQKSLEEVDPGSQRPIKENENYYLLKKSKVPTVIAECGFLSNKEEAEKLSKPEGQERIAHGLCLGILQYIEQTKP